MYNDNILQVGMSKAEIKMKFDEIAAFAEVERFLDTPVKRYSWDIQCALSNSPSWKVG